MGSGKSTVGRMLSNALKKEFVDLDHVIEKSEGKTISEIFSLQGESEFRKLERKYLLEISQKDNQIVSVGGGTPCFHGNIDYMNEMGTTIYLKMSPNSLTERFSNLSPAAKQTRPLIANKTKEELHEFISLTLQKRESFYEKAKITVSNEGTNSTTTVDRIIMAISK